MNITHPELIAGILLGCLWTATLFALFISKHLP